MMAALFVAAPAADAATALYPDLKVLPPRDLRLDRVNFAAAGSDTSYTNDRNVLRFSNTVWNAGEGDLMMRGDIAAGRGPATQLVRDTAGDTTEYPAGSFYYHDAPGHQHMHYEGWGLYQLWKAADYDAWVSQGRPPKTIEQTGSKTTSCVLDEEFQQTLPDTRFPATYDFNGCRTDGNGKLLEGLSVGWGDTYDYWRYDQWIDLDQTTLADGSYVLRSIVDPTNQVHESASNDPNREATTANDAIRRFRMQGGAIVHSDAPDGSVTLNDVAPSTRNASVNLKVIGRDDVSGIGAFRVSNDGSHWSPAYTYTSEGSTPTQMAWNLADTQYGGTAATGQKTAYVQFRDGSGKWGASQTDTITLQAPAQETPYASAVRADNPVSHWRLDEPSGVIASDAIGSRHGNYNGSPTLGSPGLLAAPAEAGHTAVRFDGVDDNVSVPDGAALDLTSAVTLEAWIKPEALPAAGQFASVLTKEAVYSIQFEGPRIEFAVIQAGEAYKRLQADPGLIEVGKTYHVVGTYDGTTQRLYINGVQVKSAALTGAIRTNNQPVTVGSWGGVERFKGTIDEPAVYGAALPPSRVVAHLDLGRPPAQTPTAPSAPAATAASSSRINVSWHDNSTNENAFVVERSTDAAFTSPEAFNAPQDATAYADTNLQPSKAYWYRIYARNSVGESARTAVVTATTSRLPAPSALVATPASTSRVNLTWTDNSTNETDFVVERATNDQFTDAVPRPPVTVASMSDTELAPNQKYWYRVRAHHANGSSDPSNVASATTPAAAPLATTSAASAVGETTATLNGAVNPQGAATAYRFEYGVAPAFDLRAPAADASAGAVRTNVTATAQLTGLKQATTYQYRLVAVNAGGTTTSTPVGTFTTTTPAAPSGLVATAHPTSPTQIDLRWADNSTSETGFVVERAGNDSFIGAIALPATAANATTLSDTTAEPNETYWYRVRARYDSTATGWSSSASATTRAAAPIATTSAASGVGDTVATLNGTVDARGAATTYRFEYGKPPSFGTSVPVPNADAGDGRGSIDVDVTLSALEPATDYQYRIVATNAGGTTTSTPATTFRTSTPGAPAAPSDLTATAASGTQINLSWTDNSSNETGFVVQRATNDQFTGAVDLPAVTGTTTTDPGRANDTTYWYRVRARHGFGDSQSSNAASATTWGAPAVTVADAADVTMTTATLGGTVDPRGAATTYWFKYGTTTAYGSETTHASAGSGRGATTRSAALTALQANTTYHYKLVATNAVSTAESADRSFTTPAVPPPAAPTAFAATPASPTRVDLSWHDNSSDETGFEIDRGDLALTAPAGAQSRSDDGVVPNATYSYRIRARGPGGASQWSAVQTVTTPAAAPTATTGDASGVTASGANVAGSVDPQGTATTWWIEYGTTAAFGQSTPEVGAGAGRAPVAATAALSGLDAGTIYRYRLVARNAAGTVHGAARIFTTSDTAATPGDQPATPGAGPESGPGPGTGTVPQPDQPRDLKSPRWSLSIPLQWLGDALRHGVRLRVKSNEAGTVTTRVLVAPSSLGKRGRQALLVVGVGSKRLAKPGTATVVVKLNATARRLLARRRSVKLWIETTVTDAAGNHAPAARTAVVLRAKPARSRR